MAHALLTLTLTLTLTLSACASPVDSDDTGPAGPIGKADGTNLPLAHSAIDSEGMFDALAFGSGGGILLGTSIKFLIDNRDPSAPVVHFMNANYAGTDVPADASKYHFYFAQAVLSSFSETVTSFNNTTYYGQDKRFVAGTIQRYRFDAAADPLYAIQLYPQDDAAEQTLLDLSLSVREVFSIPGSRLAFVATGPQQTTATVAEDLFAADIESLTIDQILGSLTYIPMQVGEAWGYLRMYPEDMNELSAQDIPVFDILPLDLTVVAGTMTVAIQDASSHINLKSKERGTPNMVLRNAGPDHERLRDFIDEPVHIVVRADGWDIFASTPDEVAENTQGRGGPWTELGVRDDVSPSSFDDLCPSDPAACLELSGAYGGKASHLGFMAQPEVLGRQGDWGSLSARYGYDLSPPGVAVPAHLYQAFVAHNPTLAAEIDTLVELEKEGNLTTRERVERVARVQEMFYQGEFPPGLLPSVHEAIASALPFAESLKIRSSANAEDVPGFSGAGLYESYRGDLDEEDSPTGGCWIELDGDGRPRIQPRSLGCAIRGVYASLWNKRAIEERSFVRIDHATAAMGLAIVERYSRRGEIAANSVVITRVLNTSGVYGYTFSTQLDNNVVTNPGAGTASEAIVAAFLGPISDSTFIVTRYARPDPGAGPLTTTIMSNPQMVQMLEITTTVELAYCRFRADYYAGPCSRVTTDPDRPRALDMELKLYENGEFLIKQVREFGGH